MADIKHLQPGQQVFLAGRIVHLHGQGREPAYQTVSLQLPDGQGIQTNAGNLVLAIPVPPAQPPPPPPVAPAPPAPPKPEEPEEPELEPEAPTTALPETPAAGVPLELRCRGTNKAGGPCQKAATQDGYCFGHQYQRPRDNRPPPPGVRPPCPHVKQDGTVCGKPAQPHGWCNIHRYHAKSAGA